ncbi:MAG: hypothetical protein J6R83_02810 [Clostridia bacterium]|nr:hypothetical protein [Clostridia bacterium]
MNEKFLFGMALGLLGGAVIVTNSVKMRNAVKQGQETIIDKAKEMQDSAKKTKKQ